MQDYIIWVVVAILTILIEVFTLGFAVICFTVGAVAAALAASVGLNLMWQLSIFSVFTIVALVALRPFAIKYFGDRRKGKSVQTNACAVVGRRAVVTERIVGGVGRVSVDGDDWKAECEAEDEVIEVGTRVEVVGVESVILTIKKI